MAAVYEVTSVTEEQDPDTAGSGDLIDWFIITFKIPPNSDSFVVKVPESGDPVTDAHTAIMDKVTAVQAIYAGSSG